MTLLLFAAAVLGTDPAVWGKNFPLQYELWQKPSRVVSAEKRGHAFSLKGRDESVEDDDPRWLALMAGYTKARPVPAGCLDCHAAERAASYWEAKTPVACVTCHEREMAVRRPGTAACARCHTDYFLEAGAVRRVQGGAREVEASYAGRVDWVHAATGAGMIEPRHPQHQMWSGSVHARSGVGCADCHMPRVLLRGVRVTDHRAGSPRDGVESACGRCHRVSPQELRARIERTQRRVGESLSRAVGAVAELIATIREARAAGVPEAALRAAREYHRRAQWRVAFVRADGSRGFHDPGEGAELLLEAIDLARRGQVAARRD